VTLVSGNLLIRMIAECLEKSHINDQGGGKTELSGKEMKSYLCTAQLHAND